MTVVDNSAAAYATVRSSMFGSNVLDVAVGLTLTYLLISLIASAVNEAIASVLGRRSAFLVQGLSKMLDGSTKPPEGGWATRLLQHPLVQGTAKDGQTPSYVPSAVFAGVLMQLVREGEAGHTTALATASFDELQAAIDAIEGAPLKRVLLSLLEQARTDTTDGVTALTKLNHQIQTWYDQAMDRVSGWYKRQTQAWLLLIGFVLAIAGNVDTLAICRTLGTNDAVRSAVTSAAAKYAGPAIGGAEQRDQGALATVAKQVSAVQQLGIPLGWGGVRAQDLGHWFWLQKLFGVVLTTFAVSLGAPFWFDVLNGFMSVRGTGPAPDERPKVPKAAPQPTDP